MWVELICGLVVYRFVRFFFFCDDDLLDVGTSSSNALFSISDRLEKLYGGKAYIGLRIPDADTSLRQNIDLVLVTKGEAVVISVKNLSGMLSIDRDGSWVCTGETKRKMERHQDPIAEAKRQVIVLESYLEQRGVVLPEGHISFKVLCPNPNLSIIPSVSLPSEVITHKQLMHLNPKPKNTFSSFCYWIKGSLLCTKKEMQESAEQNLGFVLSTAPMWDRLELKGNKYLLGEFLEFKGKQDDIQSLRNIRRSKVSRVIIQKTSMLGFAHSKLQVLYDARDYRNAGGSASEWKETTVRSSTEALFQPQDSAKIKKFMLSSIISMSLSA